MIGLLLRGFSGGFWIFGGTAFALCAICGIYKCAKCRLRDLNCIKSCLRFLGSDKFSDFEMMMLIQEAHFVSKREKNSVFVRVNAGSQTVETDRSTNGIFQQPIVLFVEQGTPQICVSLVSSDGSVFAVLKLDPNDIVLNKDFVMEKEYTMKQKKKDVLNPRIKLTIHTGVDEEENLLKGLETSPEADLLIRKKLQATPKTPGETSNMSELDLLVKSCSGPLEMFGNWGKIEKKYVAIIGPPFEKRHRLCIWKDEKAQEKMERPEMMIDVRKILNVMPDPGRANVFILDYVDKAKAKKKVTFRRIDRTRDVWVEMLHLVINIVREGKD